MTRDFTQLREVMDSNDPFMSGGHQIIKSAGATKHADRLLRVPDWAHSDQKIRELVTRCFPSPNQRQRAARMVRIIYLYYRAGVTAAEVAEELGMTLKAVERVIERINETVNRPIRPRGRPKKNTGGIGTASGIDGSDSRVTL